MFYNGYHFFGMHLIWWVIWFFFIIWIFATPYYVPGRPRAKETPLDILKRRYAAGELNTEEYNEKKKNLEA